MAFNENTMSPADMAAVMRGNGNGFGGFGNDGGAWWILVLFLFAFMGNGWGGGFGGGAPMAAAVTQADMQRGFDQQANQGALAGISGQIGQGFANAAVASCNAQTNLLQSLNANQNATTAGMNALAMSLQQTCADNRASLADLKYTVAQENNADRTAVTSGLRDLMAQNTANTNALIQNEQLRTQLNMANLAASQNQQTAQLLQDLADLKYTVAQENNADRTAVTSGLRDLMAQNTANTNALIQNQTQGFQGVQDKLCAMEIDNLKTQNEQLRTQLNMANLAASQNQQTAQLLQDNNAQTAALIQRIAPAPVPSYNVPNPYAGACNCGVGAYGA